MMNKSNEEHSGNSTNARSENVSDVQEARHHRDLRHKPKTWKEYILEFIMIFLAVTLGFVAENFREYLGERAKEKDYIEGFIRNLKDDTTLLSHVVESDRKQVKGLDSMLMLAHANMDIDSNRRLFYHYVRIHCYSLSSFKSNDATLQQLKSTGDYRLIKKDYVADSLTKYDADIHSLYKQGDYYEDYFKEILSRLDELADMTILGDTSFIRNDKMMNKPFPPFQLEDGELTTFFNKIMIFRIITDAYVEDNLVPQLEHSKRLSAFLKNKYEIQD